MSKYTRLQKSLDDMQLDIDDIDDIIKRGSDMDNQM